MTNIDRVLKNQLMATDLSIGIYSSNHSGKEINHYIDKVISMIKKFESNFSRFLSSNELERLNNSSEMTVSDDLFNMLELSRHYYLETSGIFDPTIKSILENEGYNVSKTASFYNDKLQNTYMNSDYSFNDIQLDKSNRRVNKPLELSVDLGGIGKSYILNKISNDLKQMFSDFYIGLGGDMVIYGTDKANEYDYWAIDLENPFENSSPILTLLLTDNSIATSGTYKRKWNKNGVLKNHLIDTHTKLSTKSTIISSTVIHRDIVYADIYAKTLLIQDLESASTFCIKNKLPWIFITADKRVSINEYAKKFVWQT